jgi:hypothetical protein
MLLAAHGGQLHALLRWFIAFVQAGAIATGPGFLIIGGMVISPPPLFWLRNCVLDSLGGDGTTPYPFMLEVAVEAMQSGTRALS